MPRVISLRPGQYVVSLAVLFIAIPITSRAQHADERAATQSFAVRSKPWAAKLALVRSVPFESQAFSKITSSEMPSAPKVRGARTTLRSTVELRDSMTTHARRTQTSISPLATASPAPERATILSDTIVVNRIGTAEFISFPMFYDDFRDRFDASPERALHLTLRSRAARSDSCPRFRASASCTT